jgi:hypothetical protein
VVGEGNGAGQAALFLASMVPSTFTRQERVMPTKVAPTHLPPLGGTIRDVVSQDVLIEFLREIEKQPWMVPAQLPHGSGE